MSEVRVEIDGRFYRMACGEGEAEKLKALAVELDGTVAALRSRLGEIGDRRIMVMAALTVLDRLAGAEATVAELRERVRALERSREEAVLAAEADDEPLLARLDALASAVDALTGTILSGVRRVNDDPAARSRRAEGDGDGGSGGRPHAYAAEPERVAPAADRSPPEEGGAASATAANGAGPAGAPASLERPVQVGRHWGSLSGRPTEPSFGGPPGDAAALSPPGQGAVEEAGDDGPGRPVPGFIARQPNG